MLHWSAVPAAAHAPSSRTAPIRFTGGAIPFCLCRTTPHSHISNVKLSFYAAECDDFPILGEYHENIETFEEAIKIYEKLKKDRFLEDGGIGFKLTVNGKYEGRFTLIQGLNRVIGLEKEGSFMDHPMINQVVDQAKRYVKSFEKSEMIQATVKRNTTKIEL